MKVKNKTVARRQKPKVIPIKMDATFFFERALQSLDRLHYDKALKYFRRAVEYEPDNPVNHCNMAGILSEMGQYEESNAILKKVIEEIDPTMTECYFYMSNNFANMEDYESAETSLVSYLEKDPEGQFLEESEEMMELLSYELDRPAQIKTIKSRENLFEHDKARMMLEEGKFSEAAKVLEKLVRKYPDFLAARNNLALAYYYLADYKKALQSVEGVLEADPGNLHALCNLAIFYSHLGEREKLNPLLELLEKTVPYHSEHAFKLATTMGILERHETAYRLFVRLLKGEEATYDPALYHYTAVAAWNTGRYDKARKYWKQAEKLDRESDIPKFYLSQLDGIRDGGNDVSLSYHYHLPYEEQFRMLEKTPAKMLEQFGRDPLVRSSFFWALRHGDYDTKLQILQAFGIIYDSEIEQALRSFLKEPAEADELKRIAIFLLRNMGVKEPLHAVMSGKATDIPSLQHSANLPVWEKKWQEIVDTALKRMDRRYDIIQRHDLQTLWEEFLTRMYPAVPKIHKIEGWAAALEYLTAKMHRRTISYQEVSYRYEVSVSTIKKYVKLIDETCGIREKMEAIFSKYREKL